MDVTPLIPKGSQLIESYGAGGFRVTGERFEGAIIIAPDSTTAWPVSSWSMLQPEDFSPILAASPAPEMVLLGSGAQFEMLPRNFKQLFQQYRIPVEAMDTGAACRTYNVLMGEGRRVIAALIAVS